MRRAERVHHEHVAQRGHLLREIFLVLLLALVEAHVLEQHGGARRAVDAVEPVLLERHGLAEQLGEPRGHRRERELLVVHALFRAGRGATG